jgi:flagellin-specific chaperone FliS
MNRFVQGKYLKNEVLTNDPMKITKMALQRCVLLLQAVIEDPKKDRDDRLFKVSQIINELNIQLNRDENAGEELKTFVEQMEYCYSTSLYHIDEARLTGENEKLQVALEVLGNLLEGYKGVLKG